MGLPAASLPFRLSSPLLRKSGLRPLLLAGALIPATFAQAADLALPAVKDAPVFNAPLPYELEVGARYFYSTGYYRGDLYDAQYTNIMNSRLTYGNLDAHSAETFFRFDHETGLFLKGYLGGGSIVGGHLTDEDYPPREDVYSKTTHSQSGGSLQYAAIDGGFNVLKTPHYRLGGFVGYQYFRERMNTFGCMQIATNPTVCAGGGAQPTTLDGLDDDARWQSLRLGLSGRIALMPRLNFDAEVAWAHNWLKGTDYHNNRANIWGTRDDGAGNGLQAEALLSYDLTPQLSVGVGGRYWYFDGGSGLSHWERTLKGGAPAPQRATSERYGMFLQTAYKIGGPNAPAAPFSPLTLTKSAPSVHDWSGFYLGPNIGYGMGATTAFFTPLTTGGLNADYLASVPTSRTYPSVGFVGGGQTGYNYAIGQNALVGVETDIDYAHIGGSFGYTYLYPNVTSAARTEWLGTTRLRLGWTPGSGALFFYATGGLAYGGGFFNAAALDAAHYVVGANTSASIGWAAGAGAELAVAENVSLRAEYLFVDLGRRNVVATDFGGPAAGEIPLAYRLQSQVQHNLVRLGVNYRFNLLNAGATPVLASY
ncbi:outer membrane beta-barrel protein [Methylocystis bryophila]|uniref:Outer membrane protein beta-barrel domain-containing protein n=1 Tax=Methylocystis bryophila TaxID=655015 RepID=A0A1W6MWC1_9HYPH|nr:outer membrane beta-barrel protein [Methylocystis bryophila]ARN81898.1 hypothetical protein B1812_13295 [Methylocystis bryophila]BDV37982.1 hypothetical protein DSM21852_12350 [Methylocystis bryophila]